MSVTRINFVSIPVDDQDRAIAFYRDGLGLELVVDAPYAEGWRWIFLQVPGAGTRLHFARRSDVSWQEGMPVLALVCDDVDTEAARLSEAGVEIVDGPADAPWGAPTRYLLIRDSEGSIVLLESVKGT